MKNFFNDTDVFSSVSSFKPRGNMGVKNNMTASSITNYDCFINPKSKCGIPKNCTKTGRNSFVSKEIPYKVSRIIEKIGDHESLNNMPAYLSTPRNFNEMRSHESNKYTRFIKEGAKKNKKQTTRKGSCAPQAYNRNLKQELLLSKSNVLTRRQGHKRNQTHTKFRSCYDVECDWNAKDPSNIDRFETMRHKGKIIKSNFVAKENKKQCDEKLQPHNIWAMLKKMNTFQLITTPVISRESIIVGKKKVKSRKRRNKTRKRSTMETCSSTEVAYVSSIRINARPKDTITPPSSLDETKIIDMDDFRGEPFNRSMSKNIYSNSRKSGPCNDMELKEISDKRASKSVYPKNLATNYMANKKEIGDHQANKQTRNRKLYINYRNNSKNTDTTVIGQSDYTPLENLVVENDRNCHYETLHDDRISFTSNSGLIRNNGESKAPNSANTTGTNLLNRCPNTEKFTANKGWEERNIYSTVSQRKQRFVTTMPSMATDHKLTTKEIRQRIANIKFPFVILRKDQLSSNFPVHRYEAPQFMGLDKHIWPFMIEWFENKDVLDKNIIDKRIPMRRLLRMTEKQNEPDVTIQKLTVNSKTKGHVLENIKYNMIKKEKSPKPDQKQKRYLQCNVDQNNTEDRSEMIKSLFQKCSGLNACTKNQRKDKRDAKKQATNTDYTTIDNGIETETVKKDASVALRILPRTKQNDSKTSIKEVPISSCRESSDMIENIIRKINDGAYYSENGNPVRHDIEKKKRLRKSHYNVNESTMKLEFLKEEQKNAFYEEKTPYDHQKSMSKQEQRDILMSIPGFDEPLPPLQIETMAVDTINIKHCETNITVQFDIAIMQQSTNALENTCQMYDYMPVYDSKSNSQILKCKSVIFSGKLPAEICTVAPNLMGDILLEEHSEDVSSNESQVRNELPTLLKESQLALTSLRKGCFASNIPSHKRKEVCLHTNSDDVFAFFSKQSRDNVLSYICTSTILASGVYTFCWRLPSDFLVLSKTVKMSVTFANASVDSMKMKNGFKNMSLIKNVNAKVEKHYLLPQPMILNLYDESKNILLCDVDSGHSSCERFSHDAAKSITEYLMRSAAAVPAIINTEVNQNDDINERRLTIGTANTELVLLSRPSSDLRVISEMTSKKNSKNYALSDLHKSKSSSVISMTKVKRTLSEISSLEDFLKVLGLENLTEIFDKELEERILSSVLQLRSWISEIGPNQALLTLLFCNKKQMSDMPKIWSTVLMGIAKEEITRVSELDAEIEMADKEDFCKSPEYEGFSYVPSSDENRQNILEEMCCIAKSAASDCHVALDDSYKITLKSFVDKQRKLNPKYLRVMARLTGLGLLNSTSRNQEQKEVIF